MAADAALRLDLTCDTAANGPRVNGKPTPILIQHGHWTHLRWRAAPEGITVTFKPAGPGRLDMRYAEYIPGWPKDAAPLPAYPAGVMAWDMAGATVVIGERQFGWR
jgi:hypothetical protein